MTRKLAVLVCTTVGLLIVGAPAASAIEARRVAGGLDQPVAFTFGPGRQIWYVEKATGEIRIHDLDTDDDELFATVSGVDGEGERGMLGIALHPQYPDQPFVYVYATRDVNGSIRNQILRYEDVAGSGTSQQVIFTSPAGGPYHNGGRILFGPDGMLYVVVGDAHDASNAQDRSDNDLGKILRIEPNGDIPGDNPFDDRIWAYGIRNSFGFAFDPETDRLWETDNGPNCNDEVNLIRAGGNYAWGPTASCEGDPPENTNRDGAHRKLPKLNYVNTIGITGIAFCHGCHLGAASEGSAFHGAVNDGRIVRLILNGARTRVSRTTVAFEHPSGTLSFEIGPGGRIFFSDFGGIWKLVR